MTDIHYGGGGAYFSPLEAEKAKSRYELFDSSYIEKIFKDVLNLKVDEFEKPKSWGLPHVIYIVKFKNHRDLVLRANLGPVEPETVLLTEKLIAEKITRFGVPVNKIIYVDVSRKKYPFDFQIQEKFTGLDPEIIFTGSQKDYDRISFQLGQTVAKMSDINFEKFGRFDNKKSLEGVLAGTKNRHSDYIFVQLEENLKNIFDAGFLSKNNLASILKIFEKSKLLMDIKKGSLVHYDLADHNLRYDPRTFDLKVLFDWESAVSSDPLLDLASAPTWKTLYPREEKIIEGFKSLKKLPDDFKDKMNIYRLRTILWKIDHNIKFKIINQERLKKLSNALAPYKINPV